MFFFKLLLALLLTVPMAYVGRRQVRDFTRKNVTPWKGGRDPKRDDATRGTEGKK